MTRTGALREVPRGCEVAVSRSEDDKPASDEVRRVQLLDELARRAERLARARDLAEDLHDRLSGVCGCVSLAERRVGAAHPASPLLEEARRAADVAGELADRLLDLLAEGAPEPEAVESAPVEPTEAAPRGAFLPGRRVLVVEDEELIRFTLSAYLEPLGCEVDTAAGTAEAERHLTAPGRIDLVLTDVMLAGGTGLQVREAAARTHPEAPVIYMSAHPREHLLREGLIPEGARLLQKPFDEGELIEQIREAVAAGEERA